MNNTFNQPYGTPANPQKGNPLNYFLPGQMILWVNHPADVDPQQLAGLITTSEKLKELGKGKIKAPEPSTILTFPFRNESGEVSSFVPTTVQSDSQEDLFALLQYIDQQLNGEPVPLTPPDAVNVSLRWISLNWLLSSAGHLPSTGGPSSWPVEAEPPVKDEWKFQVLNRDCLDIQIEPAPGHEGIVDVAILDTAPSLHALEWAYSEWRWGHPLIEGMLKPGGALNVYPATYESLHLTAEYSLAGHRQFMRDHGLFIAGIIHTIAPNARLHLYEVLNPYGVGTIETITRGLLQVLNNEAFNGVLLINCSLMLGIPLDGHADPDFPVKGTQRNTAAYRNLVDHMIAPLRDILDQVAKRGHVAIFAAAGNDAKDNNSHPGSRPAARYPAAFSDVHGVGSLPVTPNRHNGKYEAATYSNLSDETLMNGFLTLGGEPGAEAGIRGVYIGEFPAVKKLKGSAAREAQAARIGGTPEPGHLPAKIHGLIPEDIDYRHNRNGWAWWAGTSFATPIITGLVASDLSGSGLLPRTASVPSGPYESDQMERVVLVKQGA